MFSWLKRLVGRKPYPFRELSMDEMGELWGGDPVTAIIAGGASLLGGAFSAHAANSAANTQANAANNATAAQEQMFEETRSDQAPWREAGKTALGSIAGMSDFFNHQFNAKDLNDNLAPNYAFMRDQGVTAATNASNLYSPGGNTVKAATDYAENYAGNAYEQAFQNYSANQTNIFNRLAAIAGLGQTAGSASTTGAPSFASGIANSTIGAGNARAAGTVGTANAISGTLGNLGSWYALSQMFPGG